MNKESKKRICLVTNWYPTPSNQFSGAFFKEQAFALEEEFDFLVLHYKEHKRLLLLQYLWRVLRGNTYTIKRTNVEKNTVEYDIDVYFPLVIMLIDYVYNFYVKNFKKAAIEGVGEYRSALYKNYKKTNIRRIFEKGFTEEFDVLYCVNSQKESYTLSLISEVRNVPYVISEHAPFPWPGTMLQDVEKEAIQKADLYLAISFDKIRQLMLQSIKFKRIAYVGNMVDEEQFLYKKNDNKEKVFVMVAAHSFFKNYPLFIEVFNRLKEITTIPFRVMIVGYGANKGYSKNVEEFEAMIRETKFAESVFLIPEVSRKQIHEVYNKADAFVMTSIQEGMPVSALEAGCCGLPIFSTMCGGVEDYVDDKIGRIFKVVDSEAFAQGLKDYLEGKIVFDSEYIRKYIVERYGTKAFTENISQAFKSVL